MKASVYRKYGSPEVLTVREIAMPRCGPNEVLIKVKATTVNRTDCAMLAAKPFIMRFFTGLRSPKKTILGTDFSGVITAVGDNVTRYSVGEKVFGFHDLGVSSHAEYLKLVEDATIIKVPDNCSFVQAVGMCEGAHYAYNCLNKLTVTKGQKILVNGGTGAIGSALIQILKAQGAIVTATAPPQHLDKILSIGATNVIDYTNYDFTNLKDKFDVIFDAVGKSTFGKCKHLLTPKGIYISSELGPYIQNIPLALVTPLFGKRKVIFPIPSDVEQSLLYIKSLFEVGKFDALIDRVYSLDNTVEAFEYVLTGQKVGNVVIEFEY